MASSFVLSGRKIKIFYDYLEILKKREKYFTNYKWLLVLRFTENPRTEGLKRSNPTWISHNIDISRGVHSNFCEIQPVMVFEEEIFSRFCRFLSFQVVDQLFAAIGAIFFVFSAVFLLYTRGLTRV